MAVHGYCDSIRDLLDSLRRYDHVVSSMKPSIQDTLFDF
jgi:hypothetical protein